METHMPPPTSAHEVSFPDVLFKAELLDESPETVFLCIVPEDYGEMGMELTEPMLGEISGHGEAAHQRTFKARRPIGERRKCMNYILRNRLSGF